MIRVYFHTNLDDVDRLEIWPQELPFRPIKGDRIRSCKIWRNNYQLELEIVNITIRTLQGNKDHYLLDCELHLPKYRFQNITQFEEWYRKIRGGW